jgi:hypothetical protein
MDVFEKKRGAAMARGPRKSELKFQLFLAVSILVGLFFVEYPPLFLLGYWSWGATAHKTITGVLLVANLLLAQYASKRMGFFHDSTIGRRKKSGRDAAQ